ncbi:hypothetical protein GCM10011585_32130 [Edaphobacter dinghuensis]|uniref:Uncharacterized protein n=1 Tax=Edaphobacter dinghuensis TaxID=1560005 RepID=A0A917HQ51_9BACT|nr:hypothetical protein GCM10011585_32130 [Edaphobacter dinghuensis]
MSTVTPEVIQLDPRSLECKELLERVINSRELKRASRLRELLEYIGKHAQDFPSHTIREQMIGAAVFGRPEDYDTGLDNIVRVNVSELRKRLIHYFSEEGSHETIAIEIPRGGYLPIFFLRSTATAKTLETPALLPPATEASPATPPSALDLPEATPVAALPVARKHLTPVLIALSIAVFVCGLLLWQNHRLAVQLQPWKTDALKDSLWADFFSSGDRIDIVTADTSFALAEDILGQTISLDDYLDYKYMNLADQPGLPPGTKSALKHILERNNGSIGDFQAAKRFMDLDGYSSALKLASARSYTAESIKADNVILIGGRESNPWVDLYRDRMNFFLDYDPSIQRSFIVNRKPQPGEEAVYETGRDPNRSYSVVSFLPNLTDQRYVLIISGVDSQATRAAGDFITSPEGLAQIRQRMPTGHFPYFELVLASSRLVGTTLHTEIVASRVHQR